MRGKLVYLFGVASLLQLACAPDSPDDSRSPVVRDSAGVRIVEYDGPLAPVKRYEVGEPIYRHGSGTGHYLFDGIISGSIRPDGSAIIADAGNNEVVGLKPDGSAPTVLVREGQGPKEIKGVLSVHARSGGRAIIEDDGNGRILVLQDTRVVRAVRMDGMLVSGLIILGVSEEGHLLMGTSSFRSDAGEGWIPGYMVRIELDSIGRPDTLASYEMAISRPRGEPHSPFDPFGRLTATPDGFIYGRTDRAEITWRAPTGGVEQILRWTPQLAYPTQDDLDAYVEEYRSMLTRFNPGMPEGRVQGTLDEIDPSFDKPLPLFQSLEGHSDGSLWVADFDVRNMMSSEPREYLEVSADGAELRRIVFPQPVRILDVSQGKVLGIVNDEMDVQNVVVYDLEPSGQSVSSPQPDKR